MPNSAGGLAYDGTLRFSRPIPIGGRRIYSAAKNTALPTAAKLTSAPTGYTDHGSIVGQNVEINVEVQKNSIDIGKIATPHRFYIESQRGSIKANLQEYEPEILSLTVGGDGVPTTASGYSQVYIGGALGSERRYLVSEQFDVDNTNDSFPWDEYWWTTPDGQAGGSFSLAAEKAATVFPFEAELLQFTVSGKARLLEFRAINAAA